MSDEALDAEFLPRHSHLSWAAGKCPYPWKRGLLQDAPKHIEVMRADRIFLGERPKFPQS